ncbi:aldehyde dehydrogenase family protein [uncultured Mameliella sp.]|uniref:aldehyde dehydrogenase family protein n=1 Tax=uncultured Mameliella sp. TaxID=1447087 RepID=UPI0026309B3E|nr:aldehyde dehydrogenase family protein [uncultured Mameliella sp.]
MQDKLYIGGAWVPSRTGKMIDAIDPFNNKKFHSFASGSIEDVDDAVNAARKAFDTGPWPEMSGQKRAEYLFKIADALEAKSEELALLEVRDNGKPLPEAQWDIGDTISCFRYYAEMAKTLDGRHQEVPVKMDGFTSRAVREPIGVAAAITPWNFPILMSAWKVAPALAAGCTIVLKPSELASVSSLELGVAAEQAGLPAGVMNIVTGLGDEAGEALSNHPLIDKIAFTGSVPTGIKVMSNAAQDVKAISLELGGKSPLVVFADTPIDEAVEWIMNGIFWNQGEVCTATSRVLVEKAIYEEVLTKLSEEAQKIRIGNGLEEGVLLGPLVSRGQQEKVLDAIEKGKASGARLIAGGEVPKGLEDGCFVEPTIFADVPLDSFIWNEEIFGPVVCMRSFDTEIEAVELANRSKYGLAAAVLSADVQRAERVASKFRAGIVWINCSQPTFVEAPWGGYKHSGFGRELGEWGLNNYLETKQITAFDRSYPWGWYIK